MTTPVRIGIIGSGFMGMTHAAAAHQLPETDLVAIAGGSRAAGLAAQYGVALENDAAALIRRSDVDAVVITTPHHVHVSDTLDAFDNGKHVLVEKPMATTLADCDAMMAAAAKTGRTLAVGFHQRFRQNNREARRLIRDGELGEVHLAQINMLPSVAPMLADPAFQGKWEWWLDPRSLGHILNSGPHAIDLMRWLLDAEPVRIAASCKTTRPAAAVEDTTGALLEFSNGTICVLTSSCVAPAPSFPGEEFRFRFMGSKGVMDLDPYTTVRISRGNELVAASVQDTVGHQQSSTLLGLARMQAYLDQMQNFVLAIRGLPSGVADGQDGRHAVAACLAMLDSSRAHSGLLAR